MNIFEFMGQHPILTFFIVLITFQCLAEIFGKRKVIIHKCDCEDKKESEDE
jgi:hypothetical protein